MTATIPTKTSPEIIYPDSDGQPMSDNTKQFELIVTIQGGIDALYKDNENVFVAGDLLWYPVEGDNKTRQAPDTMVVFGRPKGYRGSYQQWLEDNIAPQVVKKTGCLLLHPAQFRIRHLALQLIPNCKGSFQIGVAREGSRLPPSHGTVCYQEFNQAAQDDRKGRKLAFNFGLASRKQIELVWQNIRIVSSLCH